MPADVLLTADPGPHDAPFAEQVQQGADVLPTSVHATFDGAGAAAFKPTLSIYSSTGVRIARVQTDDAVAAGGAAEVTFAPFLRGAQRAAAGATLPYAHFVGSGTTTLGLSVIQRWTRIDTSDPTNFSVDSGSDTLIDVTKTGRYLIIVTLGVTIDAAHTVVANVFAQLTETLNGVNAGQATMVIKGQTNATIPASGQAIVPSVYLFPQGSIAAPYKFRLGMTPIEAAVHPAGIRCHMVQVA